MVHVRLRQNRLSATDQNTSQRHTSGPGSPLTEVPGDGFYDWAGRRLFLPGGQPDPNTPGAYRYQHDPDCTDQSAPDSDPASPRYEPPHLRHRPGDTFETGGKPHDPEDPGPYGTPGWYQDTRTGRHRRNELPDPLPPEQERPRPTPRHRPRFWGRPDSESHAESAESTEFIERTECAEQAERVGLTKSVKPAGHAEHVGNAERTEQAERTRRAGRVGRADPAERSAGSAESAGPIGAMRPVGPDEPHQFTRLQEDAWNRWLVDSAPLAAAHTHGHARRRIRTRHRTYSHGPSRTVAAFLFAFHWVIAVFGPRTAKTAPEPAHTADGTTDEAVTGAVAGAATETVTPASDSRRAPKPSRPRPYTGNGYIHTWEVHFDALHPLTGGLS